LLRPDGRAGTPTSSLAAAEQYYLCWGRTWERAAWLKARPCAGDLSLGEQLMERLRPFRYRRSLDYGMLEDIGAMRDRIAAAARADQARLDLKTGPGGIRELEFLVQAQQLIWAGRRPVVRESGTLAAIGRLQEHDLLPEGVEGKALSEAYLFLRALEHRVQWAQEAQTQSLPADDDEAAWFRLAHCFGLEPVAGVARVKELLGETRAVVEGAWRMLMSGRGGEASPSPVMDQRVISSRSGDYTAALDPFATPEERRRSLETLGFSDVADAERRLVGMARLGESRRMSEVAWRRFEQVAPSLLRLTASSAAPNAALARLESFVSRAGARATTYALLQENPAVMDTLVRLFASSEFLSERLIAHPELLDALVLRGQGGEVQPRDVEALWDELKADLARRGDEAGALSTLRTFHTVELLRIGLSDLASSLPDPGTPHPWLTDLAKACVRGAHAIASDALRDRYGPLVPGSDLSTPDPLAVVGMGSLGSNWMTYGSDLDLVFLYGGAPDQGGSGLDVDPRTWANRWSQRLITALTVLTREGRCYEVDMRLRPDGSAGQIVVPLTGFRAYHRDRGRPWERLALCRSSLVASQDRAFAEEVNEALVELRHLGVDAGRIAVAESQHMRSRQRAELAPEKPGTYDLKLGDGGLVDIEFAVACVQVTRPAGHPVCRLADPVAAIECLRADGWLDEQFAEQLCGGYSFLRSVESQLRLRSGRGADRLVFPSPAADAVARALDLGAASELERLVVDWRNQLRVATAHVFDGVDSGR
ncbi:MAG TPA: hypothetical protein DIU15_10810, partial [Deltaproteobacteria bacterium]|nr:hypothetical protein [Deltaproteobacteria bacterium]